MIGLEQSVLPRQMHQEVEAAPGDPLQGELLMTKQTGQKSQRLECQPRIFAFPHVDISANEN